ncbi:MAG: hypothetical protein ACI9RO_000244 [Alteromonas macleodii]|jgi:hypothetical protein
MHPIGFKRSKFLWFIAATEKNGMLQVVGTCKSSGEKMAKGIKRIATLQFKYHFIRAECRNYSFKKGSSWTA